MGYRMGVKEILLLFLTAVFWGVSYFFIKVAVISFTPCMVVAGRLFFASLFMLGYLFYTRNKLPRKSRFWKAFLVLGLTNCTLPYILISWSEVYIDSGLAAILGATMPLFTIIIGVAVVGQESFTWSKGIGLAVGLIGVVLLVGPEAVKGLGINVWAQLANVAAAFVYAIAAVYGANLEDVKPVVATAGQVLMGFVTILPFTLAEVQWTMQLKIWPLLALAGLGIFSTAIPYIIYFYLLSTVGPTNVSLVSYLIPMVGMITGVLFLGEKVTLLTVLALFLILAGVAGVSGIKGMEKNTENTGIEKS
jgi:drug/metabolite transporter (DMT)-like permease